MQIIRATDRTSRCTLALRYMPRCANTARFHSCDGSPLPLLHFSAAPRPSHTLRSSCEVRDARSVSFVAVFRAHVRTVDVEKLLRRRRSPPLPENASDHECCEVWGGGDAIRDAVLITHHAHPLPRRRTRARAHLLLCLSATSRDDGIGRAAAACV